MITLTKENVLSTLAGLPRYGINPVDSAGKCLYTGPNGNHCIAGEVLTRLDVPVPEFEGADNTATVYDLLERIPGLSYDNDVTEILWVAQSIADPLSKKGDPEAWGKALDEVAKRWSLPVSSIDQAIANLRNRKADLLDQINRLNDEFAEVDGDLNRLAGAKNVLNDFGIPV